MVSPSCLQHSLVSLQMKSLCYHKQQPPKGWSPGGAVRAAQVEQWGREALVAFWSRWYFPANAVLYVVGDLDRSIVEIVDLIGVIFDRVPPAREPLPGAGEAALPSNGSSSSGRQGNGLHDYGRGDSQSGGVASTSDSSNGNGAAPAAGAARLGPLKRKHAVCPPFTS